LDEAIEVGTVIGDSVGVNVAVAAMGWYYAHRGDSSLALASSLDDAVAHAQDAPNSPEPVPPEGPTEPTR